MRQKPMLKRDLGWLVGRNPFAVDRLAGELLAEALAQEGRKTDESLLGTAEISARYARETYGILEQSPVQVLSLS
jgi:hypothetical protein